MAVRYIRSQNSTTFLASLPSNNHDRLGDILVVHIYSYAVANHRSADTNTRLTRWYGITFLARYFSTLPTSTCVCELVRLFVLWVGTGRTPQTRPHNATHSTEQNRSTRCISHRAIVLFCLYGYDFEIVIPFAGAGVCFEVSEWKMKKKNTARKNAHKNVRIAQRNRYVTKLLAREKYGHGMGEFCFWALKSSS